MSKSRSQQTDGVVTPLRQHWAMDHVGESAMFTEPVLPGTVRTVVLTTTAMDRPLTIRLRIDVSLPADEVVHVLWAAAGLYPDSSALLSRYGRGDEPQFFGVEDSWRRSANRDAVFGLHGTQFAQLLVPDTELYAEIDPAHGWRARITVEADEWLGVAVVGDRASSIQLSQEPFGIPADMTPLQVDVLRKASDGEALSPGEQQVLVQIGEPIALPHPEVSHAIALATLHAARLGVPVQCVHLIPNVMVDIPYVLAARELFRFLHRSNNEIKTTRTGKLPIAELRRLLQYPELAAVLVSHTRALDLTTVQHRDVPWAAMAWEMLYGMGMIDIEQQRAYVFPQLSWLDTATEEECDGYLEAAFLWFAIEQDLVAIDEADHPARHPTLEYESAQEYADSLISSALAAPEEMLTRLLDEELFDPMDPDEPREHIVFTIELLHVAESVTRRMSVPHDANLHASLETILIMFGWNLTHLWQLDVISADGHMQPAAVSYRDEHFEVPLAADLDAATVLQVDGPQLLLTYDFGDGWEMLITPQGVRTAGASAELISATGSCPPEDSGGPGGYEMKRLAMTDPTAFQRQYPDFESEEIRDMANWARHNGLGQHVPEPDFYELDEHALPYEF